MKYIPYLKQIQNNIYTELFNINFKNIKMEEINTPSFEWEFPLYLKIISGESFESILSINDEQTLKQIIEEKLIPEIKKESIGDKKINNKEIQIRVKEFIEIFFKLKKPNYYYYSPGQNNIFFVNNKVYELVDFSTQDGPIYEIVFNELHPKDINNPNNTTSFKLNQIMNTQDKHILFNKLRGIIQDQLNLEKTIFSFTSELEPNERLKKIAINKIFIKISEILENYITNKSNIKTIQNNIKKIKKEIEKVSSEGKLNNIMKKTIETTLISNIKKHPPLEIKIRNKINIDLKQEMLNFIEKIFSDTIIEAPNNEIILAGNSSQMKNFDYLFLITGNKQYESGVASKMSVRTRLYKIIISQLIGEITEDNWMAIGNKIIFSKAGLPKDINI